MTHSRAVAILSLFYHNWNFGGLLQSYALNRAIDILQCSPQHIPIDLTYDYSYQPHSMKTIAVRLLSTFRPTNDMLERIYYGQFHSDDSRDLRAFRSFHSHCIKACRSCYSPISIGKLNRQYDVFVAGSDQIWNPVFFSDTELKLFGLTFADSSKRTISYAASIGSEKAAIGKEDLFHEILKGLDYISVREQAAKDFLQPLTDKPVTVVLDPTLLLTQEQWREILPNKGTRDSYTFAYFLTEEDNSHAQQMWQITDQLPIWCISDEDGRYCREQDRQIWDAGPIEFVNYIANAEMVATNSFHGMVFSLIFRKPFWVMKRFKDTDEGSMNNRITDFLREFGLEDRLLEDGEVPDAERLRRPIDYDRVGRILEQKRAESLQWLENALAGK